MRNPLKKEVAPTPEAPQAPGQEAQQPVQIIEREVNLSLINDKLNYITGILHKIAEVAEIDLSK